MFTKDAFVNLIITWIACLVSVGIGGCLGEKEGIRDTTEAIHQEAKEAGVGEFFLDDNEDKQFRWVTNDREEEARD